MSRFISLEGLDGSGKTTQWRLLQAYLEAEGWPVVATREPGGTSIGEQIRAVLHDPGNAAMRPATEVLLYQASRAQLVDQVIRPALAAGAVVLCDRYVESTLAYQGYGRGLDLETLRCMSGFATDGLRPELIICLDLPPEVGLRRRMRAHEQGHDELTRMDRQDLAFYQRVRAGYLAMARTEPDRWHVVDAQQPIAVIEVQIRERVQELLAHS